MAAELVPGAGRVLAAFDEASARIVGRLQSATDEEAAAAPGDGGWSAAQIAHHVAAFNTVLAGLMNGGRAGAGPAAPDFVERPWSSIMTTLMDRFEAPGYLQPPAAVSRAEGLEALSRSAVLVREALAALTPSRAAMTITHPRVGTITLLQAGDWVVAHTIRHNAQMKRVLGR